MPNQLEEVLASRTLLSENTRALYQRAIARFVAVAGEDPAGWTPIAAVRWRDALARELAPQSANVYLTALHAVVRRWARIYGRQDFLHGDLVERLAPQPSEGARALTPAEGAALVRACGHTTPVNLRDRAMVILGLRTGLRRMSLHHMDFEHFEAPDRVRVRLKKPRRAGEPWEMLPRLDAPTVRALEAWKDWLRAHGAGRGPVFRHLRPTSTGGHVIGRRLALHDINAVLDPRARAAGLRDFTPHALRHTFVTWMRAGGMPADAIAAWTRHGGYGDMVRRYTDEAQLLASVQAPFPPGIE